MKQPNVLEQAVASCVAEGRVRIVKSRETSSTVRGRIEGPPGERHEMACGVCSEPVLVGDEIFVTTVGGVVHAIAHAPDCVGALMRKASPAR